MHEPNDSRRYGPHALETSTERGGRWVRTRLPTLLLVFAVGCPAEDAGGGGSDVEWGGTSLEFVSEHLTGVFEGSWVLSGLDASDAVVEQASWSDVVTASNPRIDGDRALVDVSSEMDGGTWTQTLEFHEGVYIEEDGSMGAYFVEMDGEETILIETSPDVWEYDEDLGPNDFDVMVNVSAENLVEGWKHSVKVVTRPDGGERHDITTTTRVEYDGAAGVQTAEFTSLSGYHERTE